MIACVLVEYTVQEIVNPVQHRVSVNHCAVCMSL